MPKLRVLADSQDLLGESILWHAALARPLWLDLTNPHLCALDPTTSRWTKRPLGLPAPVGAIVATTDPATLLLAHTAGIATLDLETLAIQPFAAPERSRDRIIHNDAKVDRWGRLWVGTSDKAEHESRGILWCLTQDGQAVVGDAGFAVSNGPAFSRDGRTLYFSDSVARQILAYEIGPDDPRPKNRRLFAAMAPDEGMPDGLTVDREDCLWVAHWAAARVTRWSPDGVCLLTIPVPAVNVTAVAFGFTGFDTLMITTAREAADASALATLPLTGNLFACEPGVGGMPEPLFSLPQA